MKAVVALLVTSLTLALCLTVASGAAIPQRAYAANPIIQLDPPSEALRGSGSLNGGGAAPKQPDGVERLQGERALDTMVAIVKAGNFQPGGTVVLAQLEGYWDALTAAGIAGLFDAPVLMTPTNELASQTRGLLQQLKPKQIIVCGGEGSMPKSTVDAAAKAAGTSPRIVRCSGDTATETATDIYQKGSDGKGSGWSKTAIIATVGTFQDALAAAPLAYALHMPVFLAEYDWVEEYGVLSRGTIVAMKMGGIETAYIAGGEYWISDEVESQLEEAGIACGGRLSGKTAIQTSEEVASFGLDQGMSLGGPGFATVNSYYDALCGAALCGRSNSIMLLVNDEKSSSISGFATSHACAFSGAWVFGGEGTVSAATGNAVAKVLREGGNHEWVADTEEAGEYRRENVEIEPAYDQTVVTGHSYVFSDGYTTTNFDDAIAYNFEHLNDNPAVTYTCTPIFGTETVPAVIVERNVYHAETVFKGTYHCEKCGIVGHYEYETVHVPAVTHEEKALETVVDRPAYESSQDMYYTHPIEEQFVPNGDITIPMYFYPDAKVTSFVEDVTVSNRTLHMRGWKLESMDGGEMSSGGYGFKIEEDGSLVIYDGVTFIHDQNGRRSLIVRDEDGHYIGHGDYGYDGLAEFPYMNFGGGLAFPFTVPAITHEEEVVKTVVDVPAHDEQRAISGTWAMGFGKQGE